MVCAVSFALFFLFDVVSCPPVVKGFVKVDVEDGFLQLGLFVVLLFTVVF